MPVFPALNGSYVLRNAREYFMLGLGFQNFEGRYLVICAAQNHCMFVARESIANVVV